VQDDLYRSVRPMPAVSNGRLVLMSTPFGRRGFFHHEWEHGGDKFRRFQVPWEQCPRISPEFMAEEEASLAKAGPEPGPSAGGAGSVACFCEACGDRISFPLGRRATVQQCPRCDTYIDVPEE
jgi:hypothetical protein